MPKRGENIYKRKDGRWEARMIKGCNEQGKRTYAYFYGKTYKEAKEKMFADSNKESKKTMLFETLLDMWLDNSKVKLKESSYVKYHNLIHNHIKPLLGKHLISKIDNKILNNFIADKLEKRLSENTLKDIFIIIKAVLHYAKAESILPDININVTLPKESQKDMRVLSIDEQTALEAYLCDDMDESKLGILLCLYTGVRVGEVCSLVWNDISFEENTLTIRRTIQRIQTLESDCLKKTKIIITDPKSNFSKRIIPLPECIIDKLQRFCPANPYSDIYVLTGESDKYIEPRTYQYRFKSYLSKCKIKDANFHSLRHTFATRCISLSFDIKSLSEILGHANVNITLNKYVHPSLDMKRDNMNKLTNLN